MQNRTTLARNGMQPPTVIECDNTAAEGIANDTVKRRTKAMDMSFGGYVTVSARPIQIQWAPGSKQQG
jgi:hypothetical protein